MQRAELRARGINPDVLVMTATPIPRSLAMTVYGDLDVSTIDELPPGRTPIETMVIGEDQRQEVKRLISREVKAGRQVYVVYPLVEESEKMDLRDATQRYEYLRDTVFPKLSVGLLHGKMKLGEKDEVMSSKYNASEEFEVFYVECLNLCRLDKGFREVEIFPRVHDVLSMHRQRCGRDE